MLGPWFWIMMVVVFAVLELMDLQLLMCWFLVGSIAAFIVALCKFPWILQVIVFLFVSICSLIFFRPYAKERFRIGAIQTNVPALIGQEGIVTETINSGQNGLIVVLGQVWSAASVDQETIAEAEKVKIIGIEGVVLKVQRLGAPEGEG